jgi:parvulin-like peptidyl-prolyl isomerase
MKIITVLFGVVCFQNLFAQNLEKQIENVKTIEQATEFVEKNPELEASIFSITPELDSVNIPAHFKKLELGSVISEDGNIYKAISVEKIKAFRVSYIYLDGEKLTLSQIEKLRSKIISQFKEGIAFSDLAKEYSMDGNLSGDLNWFTEGMMVPEFEEAIKMHKKDDIFTVDIPSRNWYYVTLKTYEDILISKITLLSIKNGS